MDTTISTFLSPTTPIYLESDVLMLRRWRKWILPITVMAVVRTLGSRTPDRVTTLILLLVLRRHQTRKIYRLDSRSRRYCLRDVKLIKFFYHGFSFYSKC